MYMVVVHLVHPTSNELNYPDCTRAYHSIYFSTYLLEQIRIDVERKVVDYVSALNA